MVEGYLLYVAYAMSGDVIRIISAREAQPQERRRYHEANL
ncbi:BrnT family toxin [Methylobacterium amylolyticum]